MADRFPLIVDSTTGTVKELPSGDNLNLSGSNVVNVGNIGASGNISGANINVTGIVTVGLGTTGTPSIVGPQNNTGFFFPGNEQIAVSCGGTARVFFGHGSSSGINTVGLQTTKPSSIIAIGDNLELDDLLQGFDSASNAVSDDYPSLLINSFRPAAPGATGQPGNYGFGSDGITPVAGGRSQFRASSASEISVVIIPRMQQNVFHCLCRNDVAGFRGTIDITLSDSVGGATTTVRHGLFGHYGYSTGFTTMAKSQEGANGGDLGIGFSAITLTSLGITTDSGSGLAFRWTTISGISTTFVSAEVTLTGYSAAVKSFRAGTATSLS